MTEMCCKGGRESRCGRLFWSGEGRVLRCGRQGESQSVGLNEGRGMGGSVRAINLRSDTLSGCTIGPHSGEFSIQQDLVCLAGLQAA